jgi:membrane-associated phospholipid phosphatase
MVKSFFNLKNKWLLFALTYLYVIAFYLLTNHYTFHSARYLPLSVIDLKTPFLPWTGFIYVIVYVFPLVIGFYIDREEDVKPIVLSFVAMATFCIIAFYFFPTVYPRPDLLNESSFSALALKLVRQVDTPANCFPSQHVALAFLAAFFVRRFSRWEGNLAILLAVAISISTLTTKQHYVWDVIAGYMLARATFIISSRFMGEPLVTGAF